MLQLTVIVKPVKHTRPIGLTKILHPKKKTKKKNWRLKFLGYLTLLAHAKHSLNKLSKQCLTFNDINIHISIQFISAIYNK